MKKLTTILLTLTFAFTASGQSYEPQILILTPNEIEYEKSFEKDINSKNAELSKNSKNTKESDIVKSEVFQQLAENIQKIVLSETKFAEKLDFSKQVSFISEQYLSNRFFERFKNLLILLSNKKSNGNLQELRGIADTEKMQYVLNFPRIVLFKRDGIKFAKISVQLFDNITQSFLIDSEYEGDWRNQGFEFACKDKSINCTVNNALSKALGDVISQIASNNPTIKRDRELSQLRFDELIKNYYSKPNNKDFLKPVIPQPDSNILLANQFQIIVDPAETKFVAFFIEQISPQDFKTMKDSNRDKNINIISSKDIKDEGFLEDIPQTYAYIVKGVKFNDKWYYEKSNVTYFESKSLEEGKQEYFYNLAKWNFFKENLTEFNSEFWETSLFKKIEDLKQNPDWNKYGKNMWKTQESNNRPYVGYYEIVANGLKQKKKEENENFEQRISETIFIPFYEKSITQNPKEFSKYSMMYKKLTLIYPEKRDVILNPIMITDGKGQNTLKYFLTFKDEKTIYEWTYLTSQTLPKKAWHYGSDIIEQLKPITEWNFGFNTLDDKIFWEKYVLLKTGNSYKYLTKIQ
jgi:hypothetical protein